MFSLLSRKQLLLPLSLSFCTQVWDTWRLRACWFADWKDDADQLQGTAAAFVALGFAWLASYL
jgi:hypothetical protein